MLIPKHPLFETLRELSLPMEDFAVFGSGPMWARGIRESKDLDLIARGKAWEWAQANGVKKINPVSGLECRYFAEGSIEIYAGWYPGDWDIDVLINTADVIDGIRFVTLDRVVDWKQRMGREKDQKDLVLIEEYRVKYPEQI